MSKITNTILPDRGVIKVSGEDCKNFLQGLITNNIQKVNSETALFAALLSPQGKFLYDFFVIEHEDSLLLETDRASIADLIKRLQMYKLRSKVDIAELQDLTVAADWGSSEIQQSILYADPRHTQLGRRIVSPISQLPDFPTSPEQYHHHRLTLAMPEGSKDLTPNRSLPMEWGYDHLNAIDFTKGCYVGQEVTARSKHRATLHKYVYSVKAATDLPPFGTPILSSAKEVGYVASSHHTLGLALINVDAVAAGHPLTAENGILTAKTPDWRITDQT